ncbi:hypothetical protein PVAP13_9NG471014 [Panicum virgatum]|uniref:Uncharacterized protein n=1 Tax=Panicum virgatum TaxID=38727 RepID=A0A8T0MPM6_PANVG|nr:hypothetical protein PVAP13_9NG471014 [Panicum virgatum]
MACEQELHRRSQVPAAAGRAARREEGEALPLRLQPRRAPHSRAPSRRRRATTAAPRRRRTATAAPPAAAAITRARRRRSRPSPPPLHPGRRGPPPRRISAYKREIRPVADLAGGVEEEARGWRIRPQRRRPVDLCWNFFLHLFLALGGGGSCAAARRSHEGSGLEAEVLGSGFGRRTTPCWMGAELNGGEGDDSNRD